MTAHDPNAFDQAILDDLHVPAHRLLTICRHMAPAFQRRNTIPVLATALVEAGPTGTTFRLTDLDLQITITADDLTCTKPWRACIPFHLLRSIASSLDGLIRIAHTPGHALDKGGEQLPRLTLATDDGCSATINLLCPPEDFPEMTLPQMEGANDWQPMVMAPAELRRQMDLARPCISTQETRYYLNGVFLCRHPELGTLRSVATDGHRMAVIDGPVLAPEKLNAILPTGFVSAICAVIDPKGNDTVTLAMNTARPRARVTCGPVQIEGKLIDGQFPDYTRVIPTLPPRMTMTLSANALRRLLPYATQRSNAVAFKDGRATMRSVDLDGEVSVPVQMTVVDGESADMTRTGPGGTTETWGFNLGYLIRQARLTPTFRAELSSPNDPAVIRGEDPDAFWVIMPMRV
jgi:DNA polymerase-3 subunit beta